MNTKRTGWVAWLLVLCALLGFSSSTQAQERSPFEGVRFEGDSQVEVLVAETWYVLIAIDEIEADALLKHARKEHGKRWQKRIGEDLGQLMGELGATLGATADLRVRLIVGGSEFVLKDVAATAKNRRAIWSRNKSGKGQSVSWDTMLSADLWQADLRQLQSVLETRFAYLGLRDASPAELVDAAIAVRGSAWLTRAQLVRAANQILVRFGDGHAGFRKEREVLAPGYLPFLLRAAEGGIVAFKPDRSGFLEPGHPFLDSIDGLPLNQWIALTSINVGEGSPQMVVRRGLERLRWIQDVRREFGLLQVDTLSLVFKDANGRTKQTTMGIADRRPTFGSWPRDESPEMPADVGYLRLAKMDHDASSIGELDAAMRSFADKRALIIDVRGNGGGMRYELLALAPYFIGTDNNAVVVNAGRYALEPDEAEDREAGHLANRFLWPRRWKGSASSKGWSAQARKAITRFRRKFNPKGRLTARLSELHFMVLERGLEEQRYVFEGPVLVLQDAGCFSATDIFLAGMKELPGVRTAGMSSSGGSARSRGAVLNHSQLEFKCASMASWQPNGDFFDGVGVVPDIELKPKPEDFLLSGPDSVLQRALALLGKPDVRNARSERKGTKSLDD